MQKTILVKMGELIVVRGNGEGEILLKTVLGSCVGVVMVDVEKQIGGLSHIMLPVQMSNDTALGKYSNTAIPLLFKRLINAGARKDKIKSYVAGGACMFGNCEGKGASKIGEKNVIKTIEVLNSLSIPIVFKEIGGNRGRTLIYNMKEDKIHIKVLDQFVKTKKGEIM